MSKIVWNSELEIGIPVVDGQHRQIFNHINSLSDACGNPDRGVVARVMSELVDYTYSHFAFEEALMEEAGYDALAIHVRSHDAFRDRVEALRIRFEAGEEVAAELGRLLSTWLMNHIKSDDSSYAPLVKEHLASQRQPAGSGNGVLGTLAKLLRR